MNMSWRLDGASLLLYHRKHCLLLHQGIWRSGVRRSDKFYFDLMIECMHAFISFLIFTPQGWVQRPCLSEIPHDQKKKKKYACIYLFSNTLCFGLILPLRDGQHCFIHYSQAQHQMKTNWYFDFWFYFCKLFIKYQIRQLLHIFLVWMTGCHCNFVWSIRPTRHFCSKSEFWIGRLFQFR